MRPFDTIRLAVYAPNGLTLLGTLDNARNIQWQETLNAPGAATFEVPLTDTSTALIADRCIVRLSWYRDTTRVASFSCRIQGEGVQHAVDGRRWLTFDAQPGALSLIGDAVIFPEYGGDGSEYTADGIDQRVTSPDRYAGYMSATGGPWYITADWVAPPTPRTVGTGAHGTVAGFSAFDSTAQWISFWDPDTTQTASAVTYGWAGFYVPDAVDVRIMYAFDDYGDLWVDGQQLVEADRTQHNGWRTAQTVDVRLPAGDHVIAYLNSNAPAVTGHSNPVAAVLSMRELSASTGNPTGSPIINTNATDWVVNDGTDEPAYRKAQLLLRFFNEANARSVAGIGNLTPGWTDTDDTDSHAWTDLLGVYSVPIGTTGLLDVATQLCEQGMDMRVAPATMTLNLYKRLGSDLSGTVTLSAGDVGGSLKSVETTSAAAQFTSVLTQLSTGVWVVTDDALAATTRIESGVSLGTVGSIPSAKRVAGRAVEEAAHPLVSLQCEAAMDGGPLPYVDYDLGDTITLPGVRSGTLKARVVSITVDWSEETVRVWPEVVEDRS